MTFQSSDNYGLEEVDDDGDKMFVMSQRPSDGLLASQWEFPSFIIWDGSQSTKSNHKKGELPDNLDEMIETAPKTFKKLFKDQKNIELVQLGERSNHEEEEKEDDQDRTSSKLAYESMKILSGRDNPLPHIFSHRIHHMIVIEFVIPSLSIPSLNEVIGRNGTNERVFCLCYFLLIDYVFV